MGAQPPLPRVLWVIELNGDLDRDGREEVAQQIRSHLNSEGSIGLSYGVISDDLISSDTVSYTHLTLPTTPYV